MCAAQCNGLAFYCLLHTNPRTEAMRWHLQGAVCELQPHMKEWPLKMIKEITALGCTTLLSRLARCSFYCPNAHLYRPCTHTYTQLKLITISLMDIFQAILCGNALCIVALGFLQILMHWCLQKGNGGHACVQNDLPVLHTPATNYSWTFYHKCLKPLSY